MAFARFFWDAPAAERKAHAALMASPLVSTRRKEFFDLPLAGVVDTIASLPQPVPAQAADAGPADPPLKDTLEGREQLWEWAQEDWRHPDPVRRRQGWRAMERLSASGWAQGSWRLAELIVRACPTLEGGMRAAWVLDAPVAQGMDEAALRAAWMRSWKDEQSLARWHVALGQALQRHGPFPMDWPETSADTVRAEVSLWASHPGRALPGDWSAFLGP